MNVENIEIYDIECLRVMFLVMLYNPKTNTWEHFGVWEGHNSLDEMYKYYEHLKRDSYYLIGYNCLSYDSQLVEFVLRSCHKWWDKTNGEILAIIYRKSQNIINDSNHELPPPYREYELFVPQIDLMRIAHYDNENKRTSLKWLEYMMDMPSIEDMPIHHSVENMNPGEIGMTIKYCKNDILSTQRFYDYITGNVEHEFYKGNNKIQDRIDLVNTLQFPIECLSYSDVKIGDELNKRGYCKATGKTTQNLFELKRARKPTKKFTFGDCIPKYIKFETEYFNKFMNIVKKEKVELSGDKQEFPFHYNDTIYTIAKGGIHSNESYRIITANSDEILRDADIGSQYPNAIAKRGLFPSHLGISWNRVYNDTITTRLAFKAKGKEDKKYKGLAEMYKLALNGGGFGKLNERNSWQYDPYAAFSCTIGNQFEILMLIEQLEINGIHCISANTDGIVCYFNKSLDSKYYEICNEWEKAVGNEVNGKLEYQDYSKLVQESVNCYYGIKINGEIKKKGRLDWEVKIEMNNSKDISRIERKALCNFFTKDIPIEQTIGEEKNIFMFLIGVKATRNYRFEAMHKDGTIDEYRRIIRYYVSNEGTTLRKMRNEEADGEGHRMININEGWLVTIANDVPEDTTEHFKNINYEYYITKAEAVRDNIFRKGKKVKAVDKAQLSMDF